jgi:hypothetical protein
MVEMPPKKKAKKAEAKKQLVSIDNLAPFQELNSSRIKFPEETNAPLNFYIQASKSLGTGLSPLVGEQTADNLAQHYILLDRKFTDYGLKQPTHPAVKEDLREIARGGILPAIAVAALPIIGEAVLAGLTGHAVSAIIRKVRGKGLVGLQGIRPL